MHSVFNRMQEPSRRVAWDAVIKFNFIENKITTFHASIVVGQVLKPAFRLFKTNIPFIRCVFDLFDPSDYLNAVIVEYSSTSNFNIRHEILDIT